MHDPRLRGSFRTDLRARAAYSEGAGIYRIVPAAVAVPADVADLLALVRWAADEGRSLVPRGAGSAMGGGNVGDGIVVDLGALVPRRLELDVGGRVARTSASVTHAELQAATAVHGLRLPPDPSSSRWLTLGGMLATNAAGARSLRYGPARRWVEEATFVSADAEVGTLQRGGTPAEIRAVARFRTDVAPAIRDARAEVARAFPATAKNTAGYALDAWLGSGDDLDLLVGSEGTLAIVTEIVWRLDPIPAARASALVEVDGLDELGSLVAALRDAGPSALELLDRTFLDVVRRSPPPGVSVPSAETAILVEAEARDDDALAATLDALADAAAGHGARMRTARTPAEEEAIWTLRHAASPILARLPESSRSLQVVEDGCVPLARLGEYVALLRRAAAERDLPIVLFGHAGDGHVHANLLPDTTRRDWTRAVAALYDEVSAGVVALGGTPAGEHGDGRLRAPLVPRRYGPVVTDLFERVKRAWDPLCILNPGIILPAPGAVPIARLKVGADAADIPDDIAAELRRIERTGGYATPRLVLADAN